MFSHLSPGHSFTTIHFHAIFDDKTILSILTYMERNGYNPQASVPSFIFFTLVRAPQEG